MKRHMNKGLLFYGIIVLLFACTNNSQQGDTKDSLRVQNLPVDSSTEISEEVMPTDKREFYVWQVDNETKTIRHNTAFQTNSLGIDTLISGLNEMYPQVQLQKSKLSGDTLYLHINDATYLTEKMGDAGSEQYIAQAVVNLTSATGVKYVRLDFEMGSHAEPGVWSRNNFSDYKEVK